MKQAVYSLFETPLGACAIAWKSPINGNAPVITAFQLPEASNKQTESRIAQTSGAEKADAIPPAVAGIIKKIRKHLEGDPQDFSDVAVAVDGVSPLAKQVYDVCRTIYAGRTMTYGEVAKAMKRPAASRAVGQALGKNPVPLIIPCHRVLASGSKAGGFSAHGGVSIKLKMLDIEGATVGLLPAIKSPAAISEQQVRRRKSPASPEERSRR